MSTLEDYLFHRETGFLASKILNVTSSACGARIQEYDLLESELSLADNLVYVMETMPAGWGDPMETVLEEGGPYHARGMIKATGYDQRLRETGRSSHLAELGRRHPEEFK